VDYVLQSANRLATFNLDRKWGKFALDDTKDFDLMGCRHDIKRQLLVSELRGQPHEERSNLIRRQTGDK